MSANVCPECGKTLSNPDAVRDHRVALHGHVPDGWHTCPECEAVLPTAHAVRRHAKRSHPSADEAERWPRRSLRRTWGAAVDTVGCIGFVLVLPVGLFAFWVAVSYVVMVVGWLVGAGELHAFPEVLIIPGSDSCWPYHDGPC